MGAAEGGCAVTTPYVYLAGPMRGQPRHGADAFAEARDDLRARGHDVWCPMEAALMDGFDPDDPTTARPLADYMARDVEALCRAWAVVVLPGWQASAGVRAELAVATALRIPVMEWPTLRLISIHVMVDCHSLEDESEATGAPAASESTVKIRRQGSDFHGTPAVGVLADTSHNGLWRLAAGEGIA